MVFTPEPDPVELVCDSDGGVVGSASSLDWSASCQVQYLVQVQWESEWALSRSVHGGNPMSGQVTNTTGTLVARPMTASNILSKGISVEFLAFPTFPTFCTHHSSARSFGPPLRSVGA